MVELDENALEIIFSSADSDDESFLEYYKTMPWVSIPFDNKKDPEALGLKYAIRGIPALIVVDRETGKLVDSDGRSTVTGCKGDCAKALAKWNA
jgi:nucleoredoxin